MNHVDRKTNETDMRMNEPADSSMVEVPFEFCPRQHTTYLDGYFDAVGRVLTTETDLWTLAALCAAESMKDNKILGAAIRAESIVQNWSQEFGSLVDDFLGMDQRSRLGFYLIDYIDWFKEFTKHAECLKLECDSISLGTVGQAVYLLRLEDNCRILLLFQHIDKTNSQRLQAISHSDAPSG